MLAEKDNVEADNCKNTKELLEYTKEKMRPLLMMGLKQIAALRQLTQQELIDFFNEHIKVGAPHKRTLSVRVYGKSHSSEYKIDKSSPAQASSVKIDDIFSFRRSQPLYGSFKGNHVKL